MKKLFTPPHFLGLFLVLMLFSCAQDDLENNATTSITNQLKNNLKLDQFSNKNISENLVVNWEVFSKIEKEDFEIYEIEVNEKKPSTIESNLFQSKLKYELIAIKNGTEVNSYLVEAYSNLNHDLYSSSIQNIKNFTGTLNVYELNGNLIGQLLIFNGTAKNTSSKNTIEPLNKIINLFNLKQNKNNKVPACYESFQVFTVAYAYTNHYSSVTVGNYTHLTFVKTTLETTTTTSYMSSPYPCGTNGDSYHILQRTSTYRDVVDDVSQVIEDQIKDSLDPCPKGVLDKLKNTTNNDIAAILKKLGTSKVYNVNIVSDSNISRPATSAPDPSGTNSYNIKISSNYTSATGLFRASNLLHEIIHCYFFSLVDNYTATHNPAIFNDFPTLFQKFVNNRYPGSKDLAHHDEMANTYVNAIASALQEYNKSDDPNGIIPFQVYTDLAWGGLQEAPIFKEKYPVGSSEYNRIVGRYNSESVNFTVNGQTVVGKPCN